MTDLCALCLSKDRILTPLQDKYWLNLLSLLPIEETQYFKHLHAKFSLKLCWECRTKIYKFSRFVEKSQKSLQVLESYLTYSIEQEPQSLSTLSKSTVLIEEYPPKKSQDLVVEVEKNRDNDNRSSDYVKQETKELVKEEQSKLLSNETNECKEYENEDTIKEENDDDDHFTDNFEDLLNSSNLYVGPLETTDSKRNCTRSKTKLKFTPNVVKAKKKVVKNKIYKEDANKSTAEIDVFDKFSKVVMTEEEMQKNREIKRNTPNYRRIAMKCDTCVLGFNKKETFDEHILKKHHKKNGSIVCPVCQIRFTNVETMDRHKNKHYTYYTCKLCKYETVNLSFAISHCKEKHKDDSCESIHCRECTEVCKSLEDLSQHMQTQHLVICNECGDKFKGKDVLRAHLRRIHARSTPFTCATCRRTFRSAARLQAHVARHGDRSLSYCAPCRQQFKNIYVYRRHLVTSAQHVKDT
ncbi:zinc finger protein 652 [Plutella xylostella]|uniref:zinc finger protein 652 n=1 Tax=Plutella xylostella TaxID=51655 RepID=UPI002032A454|nr:zinc finger protein 652 [Plutella xylostella]